MKWLYVFTLCVVHVASKRNNLFEGDMILSPEQRRHAENGEDVDSDGNRASIRTNLWPDAVVVHEIHSSIRRIPEAYNAVRAGIKEWEEKTCIRFRLAGANEAAYVIFKRASAGVCSSAVGRRPSPRGQDINLGEGCWTRGTVAHEIAHALGFYHEQSRPDRDKFVTIYFQNVEKGKEHNFRKYPRSLVDSLGTPYDYKSVMHYGPKAFSKNGRDTIVPKQDGEKLGYRDDLSQIDAQEGNLLYKCKGVNPRPTPGSCRNKQSRRFCKSRRKLCKSSTEVQYNCRKTCKMC